VSISGVPQAALSATPITPVIQVSDANLASVSASLNGTPFGSGTAVTADGDYVLEAVAFDRAGNQSWASAAFSIDRTPPQIAVAGVGEGTFSNKDISPIVSVSDRHLDHSSVLLDGIAFIANGVVTAEGDHA